MSSISEFGFGGEEGDLLDSAPEIAQALNIARSEARKLVVQEKIQGTCSQCGEARFADYTCRQGGATVWALR